LREFIGVREGNMTDVIYNVTVNVSEEIHDEWLSWMRQSHIPEVLACGLFKRALLMRVHAFEQGGLTYAAQYTAGSMADYERYLKDFAPKLRAQTEALYGDQVHAFRTMLEVLESFDVSAQ
jgi:hypothetical protein